MTLIEPLYRVIYQNLNTSFYAFSLIRFLVSAAILVIPTTLMGATLPILSRYFVDRFDTLGGTVGRLYAANTFGAVLGAFVSGFLLVPNLGERGTIFFAVALNLVIAAFIVYSARAAGAPAGARADARKRPVQEPAKVKHPVETEPSEAVLTGRPALLVLLFSFGMAGLASMIYQVAWTRLISLVVGSTVYAFSLMVTAFILGLALGGAIFSTFVDKRKDLLLLFAALEAIVGFSALGLVAILGDLPLFVVDAVSAFGSDFWVLQFVIFSGIFVLILIPTVMMGGTFPIVSKIYTRSLSEVGRSIGTVYSANTLGAIVGAFLAGFVLIPSSGLQGTLKVGVVINLLVAVAALLLSFSRYPLRATAAVPAAIGIAGFFLLAAVKPWNFEVLTSGSYLYALKYRNDIEHYRQVTGDQTKSNHQILREMLLMSDTIFKEEGVTATVAVRRDANRGKLFLSVNGKTDASTDLDMITQILSGHLPLLFHSGAKDVCVVGLGSGVTLGAVLQHPVERVDSIEISPEVYNAARKFAEANHGALDDPRVSPIVEDGRNHLVLTNRMYDVIISEPSNPWISGIGALFTEEFFEACDHRLKPGGVFCQWANTYDMLPADFQMVVKTFQSVFPHVSLWEAVVGGDYLLIGSKEEIPIDLSKLKKRLSDEKIRADLDRVSIRDAFDLLGRFVMGSHDADRYSAAASLHTDDNNRLEFTLPKNLYDPDKALLQLPDLVDNRRSVLPLLAMSGAGEEERAEAKERLTRIYEARLSTLRGILTLHRAYRDVELYGPTDPTLFEEAERELNQAVALNPSDIEGSRELFRLYDQKAQALLAQGRVEEAVPCYEKMIQLEPSDTQPKRYLGLVLTLLSQRSREQQDTPKALELLRRAVRVDPSSTENHWRLAEALWEQGERENAIREIDFACAASKDKDAEILNKRAVFYLVGHPDPNIGAKEAAKTWNQALLLDPTNMGYMVNLATAYTKSERYDAAITILERVLKQDSSMAAAHHSLALAHKLRGDLNAAIRAEARYFELAPKGDKASEAHLLLAEIHALEDRINEAFQELNLAIDSGLSDKRRIQEDPELKKLQNDARFRTALSRIPDRP